MLNERCSPSSPEKVKITHSTPGARSIADTAVGSQAKKKITMASSVNAAAAKNAVRVRNSIVRSLRATSIAARSRSGGTREQLPVLLRITDRIDPRS